MNYNDLQCVFGTGCNGTLSSIHFIPDFPETISDTHASILIIQNDLKALSKISDFRPATSALPSGEAWNFHEEKTTKKIVDKDSKL
jgi:hypothetical protein